MTSRLMKYEPEGACKPGLQCIDANLTVTLPAMPVTHRETRSLYPDGQKETTARPQFLVVEIAAMLTWFTTRYRSIDCRCCNTHRSEEWGQRQLTSPRGEALTGYLINRD